MNLKKPTAILTGSTGGLGLEVTKILAEKGWDLALVNRSSNKACSQAEEMRQKYPDQKFSVYIANFLDTTDIFRVAREIKADHAEVSALYNIAGVMTGNRLMSPQKIESHFAINALAPYLLTQRLRQPLARAAQSGSCSVVVNFSSGIVKSVKNLEVSSLVNPDEIGGLAGAYARSKVALNALSRFMKKEFLEDGILIETVDPGPTKTPMTDSGHQMPFILRLIRPLLFKPAQKQALLLINGVERAVKERETGLFISEGRKISHPRIACDQKIQSELKSLLNKYSE